MTEAIDETMRGPGAGKNPAAPKVSICIPTIGRLEYLDQALRSAVEQTCRDREIIILDNASGSAAQELLETYARRHPDIRISRVDERVPMFANFNRGIRDALGRYVCFFHDDDVYDPVFVDRHVELLDRFPTAAFCASNYRVIDGAGHLVRSQQNVRRSGLWHGRRFIEYTARTGRGLASTPALVFRRTAILPDGFDERLPINFGDFTILMRMAETHDVAVLAESHYAWRVHGANGSNVPLSRAIPLRTDVLRSYIAEFRSRFPAEEAFCRHLESLVDRTHWSGLLWGCLSATDDGEAQACRIALHASTSRPPVLTRVPLLLDAFGFTATRRRALLPALRRIGERMGF